MNEENQDTADVIARPPLIYLVALGLGFALQAVWPIASLPGAVRFSAGPVLVAFGVVIVGAAMRQFRAARTNVETWKPTEALVTDGLFRYSRNPIYIALSAIHAGVGVWAGNLWILVLLIPTLLLIRYGVIAREENYLEARFGDEYRAYKNAVRRWL